MANFHGAARSNYFQVKDPEAFKAWATTVPFLGVWETNKLFDNNPVAPAEMEEMLLQRAFFGVYSACPDSGMWPSTVENKDDDSKTTDLDIVLALAPHLADGQVAVLMEVGASKLTYLAGSAVAFDNTGKRVQIQLSDIYKQAAEAFGVPVTAAQY